MSRIVSFYFQGLWNLISKLVLLEDLTGRYCSFLRKNCKTVELTNKKSPQKFLTVKVCWKDVLIVSTFRTFFFWWFTISFKSWMHVRETKYNTLNYQFWKTQCFETNFISLPQISRYNWFQVETFSSFIYFLYQVVPCWKRSGCISLVNLILGYP